MTRHQLPDDQWVEVRDPRAVTYRQRKPLVVPYERLRRAYRDALTPAEMPSSPKPLAAGEEPEPVRVTLVVDTDLVDDNEQVTVNLALALVEAWSFGPPPTTADDVLDLPGTVFDELDAVLWGYLPSLFMNTSVSSDEKSPTRPSGASKPRSRASRTSTSTPG